MTETTAFDPLTGQIASVTSPEGTVHYAYDPASGRVIRTWTAKNDTAYVYDNHGRLIKTLSLLLNNVRYGTFTGLDATGNPVIADDASNATPVLTTQNAYDPAGMLDLVTLPNGVHRGLPLRRAWPARPAHRAEDTHGRFERRLPAVRSGLRPADRRTARLGHREAVRRDIPHADKRRQDRLGLTTPRAT